MGCKEKKEEKRARKKRERQVTGAGVPGCKSPFSGCCLLSQESESLQKDIWGSLDMEFAVAM